MEDGRSFLWLEGEALSLWTEGHWLHRDASTEYSLPKELYLWYAIFRALIAQGCVYHWELCTLGTGPYVHREGLGLSTSRMIRGP